MQVEYVVKSPSSVNLPKFSTVFIIFFARFQSKIGLSWTHVPNLSDISPLYYLLITWDWISGILLTCFLLFRFTLLIATFILLQGTLIGNPSPDFPTPHAGGNACGCGTYHYLPVSMSTSLYVTGGMLRIAVLHWELSLNKFESNFCVGILPRINIPGGNACGTYHCLPLSM